MVVERVYVANERLHGVIWEESGGPWVVTSLSGLLASRRVVDDAICDPHRTVVISDTHLQPLRDDEGGIEDSAARRNPVAKPRRRKAVPA